MTQKITIPQQNQPFRRQSSLGGNVSFRELGGTQDNNSVVMAKVTKVYYKQGRVDFKLTSTVNNVVTEAGDGVGSAPIPIDFYGYQSDGNVFGHYRPIQVGDLVAVAYLWGHKEAPIILGVYPTQASSYEFVAPPDALDSADDRDKQARDYALADRKIYPDGNLEYQTGNGAYYKTLNGHSFMLIDDSPLYDQLWLQYKDIGAFKNSDNKLVEPLHESAGEWLLVHEDNSKAGDADNHRTRFYVKKDGTFQVLLSKSDHMDSLLLLQGSKDEGFTVEHLYDVPQKGVFDLEKGTKKNPDLDNAQQYVKFNLGGADRSASIEATTKDDSVEQTAKLSVRADGVYINDKLLVSSDPKFTGSTIIDDAVGNSQPLQDAIDQAQQGASQAQQAGDQAIARSQSVSNEINDMKDNMATYLADSADNNTNIPNDPNKSNLDPNKSNLWGKILNNVYLDGTNYTTKMVADVLDAGTLNGTNMTVKDLTFSEGMGNHISANVIDTGTLRADVIDANSIDANKINAPELSEISKRLGNIEAGSLSIGKIDKETGEAVDPTTTSTFTDQLSWQNIYQRQDPKQYTAIPATYWSTVAGHTVTFKANYSVGNYLTKPIEISSDDLQFGFRVHFIDKDNKESDVDVLISTQDFYDNMTKTDSVIGAVQVPENTVQGFVYGYANITAGSVTLGGVTLSYNSPDYDNFPDAFKVDPTGHVTANAIDVGPGGTISGGTITGSTIKGATITGATITGATINAGDTTDFFQTSKDNIYWITDSGEKSALIGKGGYVAFPGLNIFDSNALYLGTWAGADLENGTIVEKGGSAGHPKFNIERPADSAFDLLSKLGEIGAPLDNSRISGWVGQNEYFYLKQNKGFYVRLNQDNNASQFVIQKDGYIGAYFGAGDQGKQINLVTGSNAGSVNVSGDFHVTGSKNSIVNTKQGYLAINAYETAEYYFGDIGESNTGETCQVTIGIDQIFNETVNTDITYQVFVTPYSDTHVWVKERYNNRFVVCSDKPNAEFGWELKAKRKGYESNRLRRVNVDVNPLQLKGETK